jgi:hypothetical protein
MIALYHNLFEDSDIKCSDQDIQNRRMYLVARNGDLKVINSQTGTDLLFTTRQQLMQFPE